MTTTSSPLSPWLMQDANADGHTAKNHSVERQTKIYPSKQDRPSTTIKPPIRRFVWDAHTIRIEY